MFSRCSVRCKVKVRLAVGVRCRYKIGQSFIIAPGRAGLSTTFFKNFLGPLARVERAGEWGPEGQTERCGLHALPAVRRLTTGSSARRAHEPPAVRIRRRRFCDDCPGIRRWACSGCDCDDFLRAGSGRPRVRAVATAAVVAQAILRDGWARTPVSGLRRRRSRARGASGLVPSRPPQPEKPSPSPRRPFSAERRGKVIAFENSAHPLVPGPEERAGHDPEILARRGICRSPVDHERTVAGVEAVAVN